MKSRCIIRTLMNVSNPLNYKIFHLPAAAGSHGNGQWPSVLPETKLGHAAVIHVTMIQDLPKILVPMSRLN